MREVKPPPSIPPGRLAGNTDGAAILEFALVLPLLLALVAGTVELGRGVLVHRQTSDAARAGARALARVPDPECRPDCSADVARILAGTVDRIARATGLPSREIDVAVIREEGRSDLVGLSAVVPLRPGIFGFDRLLTLRLSRYEARLGA